MVPVVLAPSLCAECNTRQRVSVSVSNRKLAILLVTVLLSMLSACGGKKPARHTPPPPPPSITRPESATKPQMPIDSIDIDPNAPAIWTQVGMASWYGPPYHNRQSANGEIFDMNGMTAAHNTLPMNSIVRVTNLKTNRSAIIRITDRGPFVGDRIIDLSMAAAKAVDVWRPGTAKVQLDVLRAPLPIDEGGRWCVQVGAFREQDDALKLKEHMQRRYHTAKVLQFKGPTGYWVRVRVLDDDKNRAQEVADEIKVDEGGVFMVRLD